MTEQDRLQRQAEEVRLMDDELRRMRGEIDLAAFIEGQNWKRLPKESSKWELLSDGTLRVNVSERAAGWVFHVVEDKEGADGAWGDAVAFVQRFILPADKSLGHARKYVRDWAGWDDPRPWMRKRSGERTRRVVVPAPTPDPKLEAAQLSALLEWYNARWRALAQLTDFTYTRLRGLDDDLVRSHAFLIRQFTERDLLEPAEFKFVNPAFGYLTRHDGLPVVAGFDRRFYRSGARDLRMVGDKRGLWLSHPSSKPGGFDHIVIAESPLTALSYQQLFRFEKALLVSFGGRMKADLQLGLIENLCKFLPRAEVRLAMDAGKMGAKYVNDIKARVPLAIPDRPSGVDGFDWNDVLMEERVPA